MNKIILSTAIILAAIIVFGSTAVVMVNPSKVGPPEDLVAVDLGLPSGTLWANMNLGAQVVSDGGEWFMWGHVEPSLEDDTCKTMGRKMRSFQGNEEFDAATAIWGDDWVTPTGEQIVELLVVCDWVEGTIEDEEGELWSGVWVVGKEKCDSVFLPFGKYWSSSPDDVGTLSSKYLFACGSGLPILRDGEVQTVPPACCLERRRREIVMMIRPVLRSKE